MVKISINFSLFRRSEKIGILLLYLFSTFWFIYQHSRVLSWDFSVYVLNAKYFFDEGYYFEPFRPPLVWFILGALAFLTSSWRLAEYIYIVIVSTLFLLSTLKLAESLGFKRFYFYLISLNIYILKFGLINGSELLSLSLFELFISDLIRSKFSAHWLALSSLTRYEFLIFTPLLLFYQQQRKVLINFLLFLIPWLPWLSFNFLKYGNMFASIGDNYALNFVFKAKNFQSLKFSHIWNAVNFLLPLAILGMMFVIYSIVEKIIKRKKLNLLFDKKVEISMSLILASAIYFYSNIPVKDSRYLFTLTLPTFYFSYIAVEKLGKIFHELLRPALFIILLFFSSISLFIYSYNLPSNYIQLTNIFTSSIEKLKVFGLNNCSVMSNGWVFLNYFGYPSKPNPWKELIEYNLNKGEVILLFSNVNGIDEPEYAKNISFLAYYPIIYKNENFIILKRKNIPCKRIEVFDKPYLYQLNETIYNIYNETINTDYCSLVNGIIFKKLCKVLNLNFKSS